MRYKIGRLNERMITLMKISKIRYKVKKCENKDQQVWTMDVRAKIIVMQVRKKNKNIKIDES